MPYVVKITTTCLDQTLPDAEQIVMIKDFYEHDLTTYPQLAEVRAFRQATIDAGNLIAKGATISVGEKEIQNTQIWKSKAAQLAYKTNPIVVNYMAACRIIFNMIVSVMPSDTLLVKKTT